MKITKMRTEVYRWKRNKPIRNGMYTYAEAGLNVVKLETDEGIEGIGLGGGMTDDGAVFQAIGAQFAPVVVGQDPLANEKIWSDLWQPKLIGRRGLTTRVISAIDNALWDIKGKAAGMPVYKLLGGFSDAVPVYIAGGYYEEGKGLGDLAREMEESVSMGARAVKMKIGGASINEDVERVRVVRDAVGPDVDLMVDANAAYRYYEAVQIARKMERYDVYWFEEPVNPDDYQGHKLVSQATSIPISTGENEYTRYGFRDLIETRAAAILQPDPLIMGGITEIRKVAAMAEAHDLPISPHGNQDIGVHVVASVPNGLTVEYYRASTDPMYDKWCMNPLQVEDGLVRPPDQPGLGIELNGDALAGLRVG